MGAIRVLKGTPGTHTHRDNHVRVRGGEVVVGEQRRQCGGTGPAGVGRWYIVQVLPGCTRTRTRTHAHTHTRTHARTRTRTCTHTCTRTQPCLQMHIPTTHVYTHAHTHSHLHCERPLRCRSVRRAELVLHRLLTAPSRRAFGACCARQTSMSISACMRGRRREREDTSPSRTRTASKTTQLGAGWGPLRNQTRRSPKNRVRDSGVGSFSGRDLRHCVS